MAADASTIITDEMRSCIGRTTEPVSLPEEISASDIRRYVDATGDANPLWTDEAFARAHGYRGRVVPPVMVLQLYRRMAGWSESHLQNIPLPPEYTDSRNAGKEIEWLAPVYLGDTLTVQNRISGIVAKQGRTALGIYVTRESTFRNGAGDVVVRLYGTTVKLPKAKLEPKAS